MPPTTILAALERARDRARSVRRFARRVPIRHERETMLLEAVAMESVIRRIMAYLADPDAENLAEMIDDIRRLTSLLKTDRLDEQLPPQP